MEVCQSIIRMHNVRLWSTDMQCTGGGWGYYRQVLHFSVHANKTTVHDDHESECITYHSSPSNTPVSCSLLIGHSCDGTYCNTVSDMSLSYNNLRLVTGTEPTTRGHAVIDDL